MHQHQAGFLQPEVRSHTGTLYCHVFYSRFDTAGSRSKRPGNSLENRTKVYYLIAPPPGAKHFGETYMLYTILIYGIEGLAERLPAAEYEALLQQHRDLQAHLAARGQYRGAVQLMPPSTALNVQDNGNGAQVLDGPYAESKEQILGFYLVDCATVEEALAAAKALPQGVACMEVRPVNWVGGL